MSKKALASSVLGFLLGILIGILARAHQLPATKVEQLSGHSVFRLVKSQYGHWVGMGTAFLTTDWTGVPVLISNAHVCMQVPPPIPGEDQGVTWKITAPGMDDREAHPIKINFQWDLCALEVKPRKGDKPLKVSERFDFSPTTPYYYVGHPRGDREAALFTGTYTGQELTESYFENAELLQRKYGTVCSQVVADNCIVSRMCADYTFNAIPGVSGSGVLNSNDEVVSVVWGHDPKDYAHTVPLYYLRRLLGYEF